MPDPRDTELIVFDVDGVLTDGGIVYDDRGVESKRFHVRDGFAIKAAQRVGLRVGVLTGRSSRVTTLRVHELGVDLFVAGSRDKGADFAAMLERAGVAPARSAFVGDDLVDLPAMARCGYPMAVADAAAEVREAAAYVTGARGGFGAAREAIEHVLRAQGLWEKVVAGYRAPGGDAPGRGG